MSASPGKPILISERSPEKPKTLKIENDYLQSKLTEKKNIFEIHESQTQRLSELSSLLRQLICDFQSEGDLKFDDFERNQDLEPKKAISIIRNGLSKFLNYHEKLKSSYELEFSRNLFELNQKLDAKRFELAAEESLLLEAQQESVHKQKIIDTIINEKKIIEQTIQLKQSSLNRRKASSSRDISLINDQLNNAIQNQNRSESLLVSEEVEIHSKNAQISERNTLYSQRQQSHQDSLKKVTRLRNEYQKESHQHNITRSLLDQSKEELFSLKRTIESYRNNLKTQELYNTEIDNQRLKSVINIEKDEFEDKMKMQINYQKELEEEINKLNHRIDLLNNQLTQSEQKLQTLLMKIPDFVQLKQALDNSLESSKKYKEFVQKRKYVLDEIQERNRILEMQKIQESKDRMKLLNTLMPSKEAEKENELKIEELIEESQKNQKEMDELIEEIGMK